MEDLSKQSKKLSIPREQLANFLAVDVIEKLDYQASEKEIKKIERSISQIIKAKNRKHTFSKHLSFSNKKKFHMLNHSFYISTLITFLLINYTN